MAGDWIKLRIDLQTHPKVVRILSATKADKFRVIGGLHAVWSVFDTHSQDGVLHGYTPETLDHIIGWSGFSDGMIQVGWLEYDGKETLKLPEFAEHNGQSGKRRAEDQKRKRDGRKSPQSVRNLSSESSDKKRTREEKRRDIKPKGFIKPTLEEVQAYCLERRNGISPQRFIDHYATNGWVQGKGKPVKDWKACVRTWEGNQSTGPPKTGTIIDHMQDRSWAEGITQ